MWLNEMRNDEEKYIKFKDPKTSSHIEMVALLRHTIAIIYAGMDGTLYIYGDLRIADRLSDIGKNKSSLKGFFKQISPFNRGIGLSAYWR